MASKSVSLAQITAVGDHVYEVEGSAPGTHYTVVTIPGQPNTCTCTGYATSRNRNKRDSGLIQGTEEYGNVEGSCRHLTGVLAMESEGKVQAAAIERKRARQEQRRRAFHNSIKADLQELENLG